jgi:uncharacterized protein (DUF952 family)
MTDEPIFHLTSPAAWAQAQVSGELAPPSLAAEGFIHCSTSTQVPGTIERHFAGVDELLLLELAPGMHGELRWDEARPGAFYPHLYRPLTPADVARTVAWQRNADGSITWPA